MTALLTPTNGYINTTTGAGTPFSYSFWFYDDGETLQHKTEIFGRGGGNNNQVYIDTANAILELRAHGYLSTHDSSRVTQNGTGFQVNYDKKKLNNAVYLKDGLGIFQFYLNGVLIATGAATGNNNYPAEILGKIGDLSCPILLGDVAYWNQDISDIITDVYNGGDQSNWMNLSKQPFHYWKLGESYGLTNVPDEGTNGTNHFIISGPLEPRNYTLVSGDGSNYTFSGDATGSDPTLNVIVGDVLTFTNNTGGHPLAIKNSLGVDVATESSGITSWTPTVAGKYNYYCTAHPADMIGSINVNEAMKYLPIVGIERP
jgi:hypothetical protein